MRAGSAAIASRQPIGPGHRIADCDAAARVAHVERIIALFAGGNGKTQAEIARECGCSQSTVSRILRAAGVVSPRRGWVRKA